MAALDAPAPVAQSRTPGLTSIVMLTWNQLPVTQDCIASLRRHTNEPYELIVVDNGSRDGTREWLAEQTDENLFVEFSRNQANRVSQRREDEPSDLSTQRLEEEAHWNRMLSLGEQQRLGLARALLQQPDYLFLDEATASLDENMEAAIYRTLLTDALGSVIAQADATGATQTQYQYSPYGEELTLGSDDGLILDVGGLIQLAYGSKGASDEYARYENRAVH